MASLPPKNHLLFSIHFRPGRAEDTIAAGCFSTNERPNGLLDYADRRNTLFGLLEPEVPEADRPMQAWINTTGSWDVLAVIVEGRRIHRDEYGKKGPFGWEVDRIVPGMAGGMYTRSNIRARHHQLNALHGGYLSSLK